MDIEARIDALYGLPREEFTKARNALVRSLRDAGDREAAERAKTLTKPDQVSWAINQAVREEPGLRDQLLETGDSLRESQNAALAGEGNELREAMRSERDAVNALMKVVGGHLGRSHLDDAASTLHAASSSEAVRDQLARGRLTKKARPTGMGGVADAPRSRPPRRTSTAQLDRARAAARRKRDDQRAADIDAREAARAVEKAQRELARLEKRARSQQAKADKAREAAEAAEAKVRRLTD